VRLQADHQVQVLAADVLDERPVAVKRQDVHALVLGLDPDRDGVFAEVLRGSETGGGGGAGLVGG